MVVLYFQVIHGKQLIGFFKSTSFKLTLYILWLSEESTSLCLLPNDIVILMHRLVAGSWLQNNVQERSMYHLMFLLLGCDYGMGTHTGPCNTLPTLNLRLRTRVKYDKHMWRGCPLPNTDQLFCPFQAGMHFVRALLCARTERRVVQCCNYQNVVTSRFPDNFLVLVNHFKTNEMLIVP